VDNQEYGKVGARTSADGTPRANAVSIGYWESWDTVCNRIAKRLRVSNMRIEMQFQHINETVEQFQQRQQPVISVDAKKKELIGA